MLARKSSAGGAASGTLVRLRHDRATFLTGALLVATAALSWMVLILQGRTGPQLGMGGGMNGDMAMSAGPGLFSPLGVAAYLAAWGVMMAAMMLPSATPLIALYATIRRGSPPGQGGIPAVVFALVYLAVWVAAGIPVYAASVAVATAVEVSPLTDRLVPYGAALTLLVAGVYQFTPLKSRCLSVCQSPFGFLMGHWRAGTRGTLRMALEHALYCLGCCVGLMAVLVAAGAMALVWALLIATVVFAEKVLPRGEWTARVAGAALVFLGLLVVAEPGLAAALRM
jgi:predicted metal-binding membrane protein